MLVVAHENESKQRLAVVPTPANRDSNAAVRGDVSVSMTSEFDGPKEDRVHCILERALAAN